MAKGFGKQKTLSDNEIITGVTQHPTTKRWQSWVSFTGNDIQCITAHNSRDDANDVAWQIAATWESGKLHTQKEVTAFLDSLPSDGLVDPLPQEVLIRLSKLALKSK